HDAELSLLDAGMGADARRLPWSVGRSRAVPAEGRRAAWRRRLVAGRGAERRADLIPPHITPPMRGPMTDDGDPSADRPRTLGRRQPRGDSIWDASRALRAGRRAGPDRRRCTAFEPHRERSEELDPMALRIGLLYYSRRDLPLLCRPRAVGGFEL